MLRVKTAVLISGNGSNLQALIDAAAAPGFPAEIALVISNKPDAYGLTRATHAGIATHVIAHRDYPTRDAFDSAMSDVLVAQGIQLICLAGFMRILSDGFVQQWENRLINIHPSLLPKYKGLNTHQRALDAGDAQHGATVHWVIPELDAGPIILQEALAILPGDTAETLQARVHALEHRIYPAALAKVAASG
ncbi:MAG: phosphoribosylglycinamide formyltransferase [Pseudomonadota bacterium]